jgi:predicted N-acetyltransferase YhbS
LYVRDVLPFSAEEWAGSRSFERYAGDLRDFVNSGYGRRHFRLIGMRVDGTIVTSCKRYERDLRCGERQMRAIGIGAVFTRPSHRGRGLATAMLAALLDAERQSGTDLAFLFSDIRPHFYQELGFAPLPSRLIALRADSLSNDRITASRLREEDIPAIARCFAALDETRRVALRRTPIVWDLVGTRHRIGQAHADTVDLAVRSSRGGGVLAYCLGRRVVKADAYVLDELGFTKGQEHLVAPLLRAASGDLRKITGWLPPQPARDVLPRGTVRARRDAILMATPLSRAARAQWRTLLPQILRSSGDPLWSTDHI